MTAEKPIQPRASPPRRCSRLWIVVLVVGALWAACFAWPRIWALTGLTEGHQPFLDLDGVLAAGEAAQLGMDPFKPNPIDTWHRPHVYTTWWLVTGKLGLTRADTPWVGAGLVILTLLSAVWLIRPTNGREAWLAILVLVSPAILMAINRGNNDLVAFILMCGALGLLRREGASARLLGVVILAVAAVLKYYPLVAAVVFLDARNRRELLSWTVAYLLVLIVAWPSLAPALAAAAKYRPSPEWIYAFGAPVLFRDLGLAAPPTWVLAALGLGLALLAWRGKMPDSRIELPDREAEREFAVGAALVVASFALGSSYAYKLVFAVWLLPWLWRPAPVGKSGRWQRVTLALLLAVLWLDGLLAIAVDGVLAKLGRYDFSLRVMQAGLVCSQLLAWALAVCLLRWLLVFAFQRLAAWPGRPNQRAVA